MNNLDVQVLTSFTRKLAYAAEKMAAGRRPFVDDPPRLVPDITSKPRAYSPPALPSRDSSPPLAGSGLSAGTNQAIADALGGGSSPDEALGVGATMGVSPAQPISDAPSGPLAAGTSGSPMSAVPFPETGSRTYQNATMSATPQNPTGDSTSGDQQFNLMRFLSDNAGSIGAAGAGGLGAMALARLFNSSKDDEEESSWAPWLAGAAGAGLGYGAWNYGPQLAQALSGMLGYGDGPLQMNAPDGTPVAAT